MLPHAAPPLHLPRAARSSLAPAARSRTQPTAATSVSDLRFPPRTSRTPVGRPGTTEGQFEPGTIGSPRQFEANAKRKSLAKQSLEARLAERGSSGWASAQGEYKPLGAIAELPDTGNELRYKTKVRDAHRKPRVVVPLEDGKAAPVEDVLSKTKVLPGKTVRGEVPQFEYKYYEVELRRRCELVVSVDTLSGDPDIFVSNRTGHYPTQFDYTWQSASTGDDEVVVKTDHPAYCLGRYTIGVYGVYPDEFELLVVLQEPPLRLNLGELDEFSSNGYPLLSKLVGEAEERRARAAAAAIPRRRSSGRRAAARARSPGPPHLAAEMREKVGDGGGGGAASEWGGSPGASRRQFLLRRACAPAPRRAQRLARAIVCHRYGRLRGGGGGGGKKPRPPHPRRRRPAAEREPVAGGRAARSRPPRGRDATAGRSFRDAAGRTARQRLLPTVRLVHVGRRRPPQRLLHFCAAAAAVAATSPPSAKEEPPTRRALDFDDALRATFELCRRHCAPPHARRARRGRSRRRCRPAVAPVAAARARSRAAVGGGDEDGARQGDEGGAPRKVRLTAAPNVARRDEGASSPRQMERVASGLQSERPMIASGADAVEQLLAGAWIVRVGRAARAACERPAARRRRGRGLRDEGRRA